tara:strand:- start:3076 stop:3288 length:213 start_codon:yes stop_codon:yes gene_type:complete
MWISVRFLPEVGVGSTPTRWTNTTKMNTQLTFEERAKLGMSELSKQPPVTLEFAIQQAKKLSLQSKRRKQ